MKLVLASSILGVVVLAGCASSPAVPAGMQAGKFVGLVCEGGKSFQARAANDGSTVRIRYEGGYELDTMGGGVYEGSGWKLVTQGPGATALHHNGKLILQGCKSA